MMPYTSVTGGTVTCIYCTKRITGREHSSPQRCQNQAHSCTKHSNKYGKCRGANNRSVSFYKESNFKLRQSGLACIVQEGLQDVISVSGLINGEIKELFIGLDVGW